MTRFMRYSGSKLKYTKLVNSYINSSNKTVYVEPFVGSGAILFNLEKEFDKYVINDIDRNIIRIYKTFKEITYQDYLNELKYVENTFGSIKDVKENYYNFRDWFNRKHWKTDTIVEGIYLHLLANSCINSMLRFGPNGMNQSYGNRLYVLNAIDFNHIKSILQKTTIMCVDYKEVLEMYPCAAYFIDPPYFTQSSGYDEFSKEQYIEFLRLITDKEYVYTDIQNDYNKSLKGEFIRDMISTAPSRSSEKRGNLEYLYYNNIEKVQLRLDDW